jgi:CubicO group peptidase (beta-lactamase class C family)
MASGPATARLDAQRLDPVFDQLERSVRAGHVPAAALAIGDAEGPIRSQTFTSDAGRSIDRESLFFLASLTKPIFATAMMQLVEDGRLDLHAPLAGYMPEFGGPQKRAVTTWHLLTHTSGVPDILPEVIRRDRPSARRMTQLTLRAPLRFEPGSRWEYCSASYYVMAELMRRITGVHYRRYLAERLFAPLGMNDTAFSVPASKLDRLASSYWTNFETGEFEVFDDVDDSRWARPPVFESGAGGLVSTVDDLLAFGQV